MKLDQYSDSFEDRHLGLNKDDENRMLSKLGFRDLDEFLGQVIPQEIKSQENSHKLPLGSTELKALGELEEKSNLNISMRSLIGLGYYGTHMPEVIKRHVFENPRWYTAYTPYQAEISQGRLEALFNFQTLICELTGFPISNASLLDEGTAAAEAMAVAYAARKNKGANVFLVHESVFNHSYNVLVTRANPSGIVLRRFDGNNCDIDPSVFGILIQLPGQNGELFDPSFLVSKAHKLDICVCAAIDPLAQILIKPIAHFGVDIAIGSMQRFGVPIGFGGPHAAFFACMDKFKRLIPGRIVGETVSRGGEKSLRLALQTREQHIRREKATSNICTAQSLLAVTSSFYAIYHGFSGLRKIAERIVIYRRYLERQLQEFGFQIDQGIRFDSFDVYSEKAVDIHKAALKEGFNLRILPLGVDINDATGFGISLDEITDDNEIFKILSFISTAINKKIEIVDKLDRHFHLDGIPLRKDKFLQQNVFQLNKSESELMRYIYQLAEKDFSLVDGMIPLGSCTMKLNAAAELSPVSWSKFSAVHPFSPKSQTRGFLSVISDLEEWISEIVGLEAVSFQPNAGSQGELAGLLSIRSYFYDKNDLDRDICLIPKSAHGTNPASAVMAGFKVVSIECDGEGNIDIDNLSLKIKTFGSKIGALMITYPSTHGVFEERIRDICDLVHGTGAFVYLDGANLNAQVGLCKPGNYGVDVCHLNLHKTFCIPHGGGGPGVGPIAVTKVLKPYLPKHNLNKFSSGDHLSYSVSSSEYGSASILPISWMYIRMMGYQGLRRSSSHAILSANYIAFSLKEKFKILYKGKNNFVAHECILDFRDLKQSLGLGVNDIAKRLIDYCFHAPTISWPVAETMMIEPTESESLKEIDRFCDAMLSIGEEILEIKNNLLPRNDNPIINAPHTLKELIIENWDRPYSKERAAYPYKINFYNKYWSPVSRINNAYGDRNLVCSCSFENDENLIEEKKCA